MSAAQVERNGLPIPQVPTGPYQEFPYESYSTTQGTDVNVLT
ncbi:hypothetical protein V7183_13120 [Bacillus sp. JJ1127]